MSAVTVPPAEVAASPRPAGTPARSAAERAARARAVLARAEERTGASRWVRPAAPPAVPATPAGVCVVVPQPAPTPDPSTAATHVVEPAAEARVLPVRAAVAGLLPSGGLDRGSTVVVAGSTSLVLELLVEVSRSGGWVALVGLPTVGVLAAHQRGLDLDRTILVPAPGADGPTVVAALLDGVDVVVVGPGAALGPADQRRLTARARERSAVLLPTAPWPGAHVVLTAEASRWEGLGRGDGRLRSRRLLVRRTGRGVSAREHRAEVGLPEAPPAWDVVRAPAAPTATSVPLDVVPDGLWADEGRRVG